MVQNQTYYPSNANYGINLLFSGAQECLPKHTFGPAKRTNYIFHYVASGKGTYHVGHQSYKLEKGQGFLIYPGEISHYVADPNDPWTYIWLGFDGSDSDSMLRAIGLSRSNHICSAPDRALTYRLLKEIIMCTPLELMNPMKRTAQLTSVLASLIPEGLSFGKDEDSHIKQALDFVHNNYQYDMKISHLANTVNLERTWLYRLFQEETGRSPKAYLTDYRLKMAKYYLSSSLLTLTEVALSCGFASSSAFHKHFKNAFGITPKAYRELH